MIKIKFIQYTIKYIKQSNLIVQLTVNVTHYNNASSIVRK